MNYQFPCGCSWPILEESPSPDVLPLLDFRIENAPDSCPATWDLIGQGRTKGIFQLESPLGRQWSKRLRPISSEHLAALGALLRPGALRAKDDDGVSMTEHYCRRKNGEEEVVTIHPILDKLLATTYGTLTYQEQSMMIGRDIAAFDLMQVDKLRKAIGKKDQKELAEVRKIFLDGAKNAKIVSEDVAETIWGWIEKSGRYQFNKSHSLCYGLTGYESAYIKAHFPLAFFVSWLDQAKNKQDPKQEIFELVNDAKLFDIEIEPPDIRSMEPGFHTDRKVVKFGLADIKGIGDAQIQKLQDAVAATEQERGKSISDWTWNEFLVHCTPRITSSVVIRLIHVGALRFMNLSRKRMEAQFNAYSSLTDIEKKWVGENADKFTNITEAMRALTKPKKERVRVPRKGKEEACAKLEQMKAAAFNPAEIDEQLRKVTKWEERVNPVAGGCSNQQRIDAVLSQVQLLEHPPTSQDDSPHWVSWIEEDLLGIALSCSRLDACDLSQVNCSCKDFLAGREGFMLFGVEVQQAREVKTKNGKNPGAKMAFLTIADSSCSLEDVVVFPDTWKEFGDHLIEGQAVILQGERTKNNTLSVKKVWPASMSGRNT